MKTIELKIMVDDVTCTVMNIFCADGYEPEEFSQVHAAIDKCVKSHLHESKKQGASPSDSVRSNEFFDADVHETVDYVLDHAAMYHDRQNFIAAVMKNLKPWRDETPNEKDKE